MNKAQLCNTLERLKTSYIQDDARHCAADDADPWYGEVMKDIPEYRRYRIGNQCYDLINLAESLERGEESNPFTRERLPVDDIKDKFQYISLMLDDRDDFYERIKSTPIMSKTAMLSRTLANIWSKLAYPTNIEFFNAANDSDLKKVLDAWWEYSVLDIHPSDVNRFNRARDKREVLIDVMNRIVNQNQDENTATRLQALESGINNNIRSLERRRRGSEAENAVHQRRRLEGGGRIAIK